MSECVVCKGSRPTWQVESLDYQVVFACKDHISNVLADVARRVPVTVRGINHKEESHG